MNQSQPSKLREDQGLAITLDFGDGRTQELRFDAEDTSTLLWGTSMETGCSPCLGTYLNKVLMRMIRKHRPSWGRFDATQKDSQP